MRARGAGARVLPVLAASMAVFRSCSHLAFSSWVLRAGLRFRSAAGQCPLLWWGRELGGPEPPPPHRPASCAAGPEGWRGLLMVQSDPPRSLGLPTLCYVPESWNFKALVQKWAPGAWVMVKPPKSPGGRRVPCAPTQPGPAGCGRTQALLWEVRGQAQLSADPHGGPTRAARNAGLLPRDVPGGRGSWRCRAVLETVSEATRSHRGCGCPPKQCSLVHVSR